MGLRRKRSGQFLPDAADDKNSPHQYQEASRQAFFLKIFQFATHRKLVNKKCGPLTKLLGCKTSAVIQIMPDLALFSLFAT